MSDPGELPLAVKVAAATRSYPGETANGDAWAVQRHAGTYRIAVIDGLGHGPAAAAAAAAALRCLGRTPGLDPAASLLACHAALAGTRGAAISVVTIDPVGGRLSFAGVGNVEARLWSAGTAHRPMVYRGIVGAAVPTVRAFNFPLADDWLLVVHTDGIQLRNEPETLPAFAARDAQALADSILARWGRETDDATALVVVPAAVPTGP